MKSSEQCDGNDCPSFAENEIDVSRLGAFGASFERAGLMLALETENAQLKMEIERLRKSDGHLRAIAELFTIAAETHYTDAFEAMNQAIELAREFLATRGAQ